MTSLQFIWVCKSAPRTSQYHNGVGLKSQILIKAYMYELLMHENINFPEQFLAFADVISLFLIFQGCIFRSDPCRRETDKNIVCCEMHWQEKHSRQRRVSPEWNLCSPKVRWLSRWSLCVSDSERVYRCLISSPLTDLKMKLKPIVWLFTSNHSAEGTASCSCCSGHPIALLLLREDCLRGCILLSSRTFASQCNE